MVRKKKRFDLNLSKLGDLIWSDLEKKLDSKKNPSTDDIREAIDSTINPPGTAYSGKWVDSLYPVKYPSGHVILAVQTKGSATQFVQHDYTYDNGEINVANNGIELEDTFKIKKGRKEGGNEELLKIDILGSLSYELPEPIIIEGIQFEKGQELRMVTGVVLEPDIADGQGDIYSADEVRKTAHEFMVNYSGQGNGFMHKSFGDDNLPIVESYCAPVDFTIGKEKVKKGTWLMTSLVLDDKKWAMVKKGELTGYSIRGRSNIADEN